VGLLANNARYVGVALQRLSPLPLSVVITDNTNQANGTGGANELPLQVSGIVTLKTNLAGRANRGRMYIPFPPVAAQGTDGHPTNGYVTAVDTLAAIAILPQTVGTAPNQVVLTPVVYHKRLNTTTDITDKVARQRWATQRRRGDYGKPNPIPI
jgi:hypothetical protein